MLLSSAASQNMRMDACMRVVRQTEGRGWRTKRKQQYVETQTES